MVLQFFSNIIGDNIDKGKKMEDDAKEMEHTSDQDLNSESLDKDDKATTNTEDELEAALVKVAIDDKTKIDSDDDMFMETGLSTDTEDLRKEDGAEDRKPTEKGYM